MHSGPLVQGRAEEIPLRDDLFDMLSMGFALRHVATLEVAFAEYRRVLKPGGRLLLLEVSRPRSAVIRWAIRVYFQQVLPLIIRDRHREPRCPASDEVLLGHDRRVRPTRDDPRCACARPASSRSEHRVVARLPQRVRRGPAAGLRPPRVSGSPTGPARRRGARNGSGRGAAPRLYRAVVAVPSPGARCAARCAPACAALTRRCRRPAIHSLPGAHQRHHPPVVELADQLRPRRRACPAGPRRTRRSAGRARARRRRSPPGTSGVERLRHQLRRAQRQEDAGREHGIDEAERVPDHHPARARQPRVRDQLIVRVRRDRASRAWRRPSDAASQASLAMAADSRSSGVRPRRAASSLSEHDARPTADP